MKKSSSGMTFPSLTSFEEYKLFKQQNSVLENMAREIIDRHSLPEAPLVLFSEGTNIVFAYEQRQVIKLFPPFHQDQFKSELLVLKHLQDKLSVKVPVIEYNGNHSGWPYIVMSQLEGTLLETLWDDMNHDNKIIILRELGKLIHEVHSFLPI